MCRKKMKETKKQTNKQTNKKLRSKSGANVLIYAQCFRYANVAFTSFAPDLLFSIYIFASYLLRANL